MGCGISLRRRIKSLCGKFRKKGKAHNGSVKDDAASVPRVFETSSQMQKMSSATEVDGEKPLNGEELVEIESSSDSTPASATYEGICLELWAAAYETLQDEEKDLVDVYEKVLTLQIIEVPSDQTSTLDENRFAGCTVQEKMSLMKEVTRRSITKADRQSEIKEGAILFGQLVSGLNSFVSSFLNSNPIAGLAWSGICTSLPVYNNLVLILMSSDLVQFMINPIVVSKLMSQGLEHLIDRMHWYLAVVEVFLQADNRGSPGSEVPLSTLRAKVTRLYMAILQYEMQSVCYCYHDHPVVKTLQATLTLDDWESRLRELRNLESRVEDDLKLYANGTTLELLRSTKASTDQLTDVSRHLNALIQEQDRLRIEQILASKEARRAVQSELAGRFKTIDYERRMNFNPDRVQGTCEWFCGHKNFRSWLADDVGLLLMSADPGCGKSTLAKYLIKEVLPKHHVNATIAYFFFKDNEEQRSLGNGLSAILHQIFLENGHLANQLADDIRAAGNRIHTDCSALWQLLTKALAHSDAHPIICVFDALDECDPVGLEMLVGELEDLFRRKLVGGGHKVKFLLTTRGYPHITEMFQKIGTRCTLLAGDGKDEKDKIQEEIPLVLEYKLERLIEKKNLTQELKDLIRNVLLNRTPEQRTYLWLSLVFEILERNFKNTAAEWEALIKNPPDSINKAYTKLLDNVETKDESRVRLLFDLVISAHRPLTLREINIALEVHHNDDAAASEKDLDIAPDEDFKKWLLQACGFFIAVYGEKAYFIHQTAKEFLVGDRGDTSLETGESSMSKWYHSTTFQQSNRSMTECCIAYLSLRQFRSSRFQTEIDEMCSSVDFRLPFLKGSSRKQSEFGCCAYGKDIETSGYYGFFDYSAKYFFSHSWNYFWTHHNMELDSGLMSKFLNLFSPRSDGRPPEWFLGLSLFVHFDLVHGISHSRFGKYFPIDISGYMEGASSGSYERLAPYNYSVPCIAAFYGCRNLLSRALKFNQGQDWKGRIASRYATPLHIAVVSDSLECVELLVAEGAMVDVLDEKGRTPLLVALQNRNPSIVKVLSDHSTNMDTTDELGNTLLHYAVIGGHVEYAELLISNGAAIDRRNARGSTPLFLAITERNSSLTMIKLLIESGATIHAKNSMHETPLSLAILRNRKDVTELLVHHGALVFQPDANDFTFLQRIISRALDMYSHTAMEYLDTMKKLVLAYKGHRFFQKLQFNVGHVIEDVPELGYLKADVEAMMEIDTYSQPSFLAAYEQSFVKFLINSRVTNIKRSPGDYENPDSVWSLAFAIHGGIQIDPETVELAAQYGNRPVLALLLQSKQTRHFAMKAINFHAACHSGSLGAVKLFLQNGATIQSRDDSGKLPLHRATSVDVAQLLCDLGADPNSPDEHGNTPLHIICGHSSPLTELVVFLLARGARVDATNASGRQPLHEACTSLPIIETLLRHGAITSSGDNEGQTALHLSCKYGQINCIKTLLRSTSDVNDKDLSGRTALHWALHLTNMHQNDRSSIVQLLLEHGTKVDTVDSKGETALHYALKLLERGVGHSNEVRLLVNAGANVSIVDSKGRTPLTLVREHLNDRRFKNKKEFWKTEKVLKCAIGLGI